MADKRYAIRFQTAKGTLIGNQLKKRSETLLKYLLGSNKYWTAKKGSRTSSFDVRIEQKEAMIEAHDGAVALCDLDFEPLSWGEEVEFKLIPVSRILRGSSGDDNFATFLRVYNQYRDLMNRDPERASMYEEYTKDLLKKFAVVNPSKASHFVLPGLGVADLYVTIGEEKWGTIKWKELDDTWETVHRSKEDWILYPIRSNPRRKNLDASVLGALILGGIIGHSMKNK